MIFVSPRAKDRLRSCTLGVALCRFAAVRRHSVTDDGMASKLLYVCYYANEYAAK